MVSALEEKMVNNPATRNVKKVIRLDMNISPLRACGLRGERHPQPTPRLRRVSTFFARVLVSGAGEGYRSNQACKAGIELVRAPPSLKTTNP